MRTLNKDHGFDIREESSPKIPQVKKLPEQNHLKPIPVQKTTPPPIRDTIMGMPAVEKIPTSDKKTDPKQIQRKIRESMYGPSPTTVDKKLAEELPHPPKKKGSHRDFNYDIPSIDGGNKKDDQKSGRFMKNPFKTPSGPMSRISTSPSVKSIEKQLQEAEETKLAELEKRRLKEEKIIAELKRQEEEEESAAKNDDIFKSFGNIFTMEDADNIFGPQETSPEPTKIQPTSQATPTPTLNERQTISPVDAFAATLEVELPEDIDSDSLFKKPKEDIILEDELELEDKEYSPEYRVDEKGNPYLRDQLVGESMHIVIDKEEHAKMIAEIKKARSKEKCPPSQKEIVAKIRTKQSEKHDPPKIQNPEGPPNLNYIRSFFSNLRRMKKRQRNRETSNALIPTKPTTWQKFKEGLKSFLNFRWLRSKK